MVDRIHDVTYIDRSPETDWKRLTPQAQRLLQRFAEAGNEVAYVIEGGPSEEVDAAVAELLLLDLFKAVTIPGESKPGYMVTMVGHGVILLGRPEAPADAAETKRVSGFLRRKDRERR